MTGIADTAPGETSATVGKVTEQVFTATLRACAVPDEL